MASVDVTIAVVKLAFSVEEVIFKLALVGPIIDGILSSAVLHIILEGTLV